LTGRAAFPIVARMATTTLDLIGLNCPLPVLKTRKALGALQPGDHLEVHCSDPLAAIDIPHMVRESGDRLASVQQGEAAIVFLIEKAGAG
jgi:tRNA 2-thiouridine synthesizing protein A